MSATGRSDVRVESDYYPTPAWCVHRLGWLWFKNASVADRMLAARDFAASHVGVVLSREDWS